MESKKSSEEKLRYFVAILLSLIVLLIWTYFSKPAPAADQINNPSINQTNNSVTDNSESLEEKDSNNQISENVFPLEKNQKIASESKEIEKKRNLLKTELKEEIVSLKGKNLKIDFSTRNGVVKKVFISYQNNNQIFNTPNIENSLFQYETGNIVFRLENNPPINKFYQILENSLNSLVFQTSFKIQDKTIIIKKTYSLDGYKLNLKVNFFDEMGKEIKVNFYLLNGSNIGITKKEKNIFDITELAYTVGNNTETVLSRGFFSFFGDEKNQEILNLNPNWISIDNRFFARILKSRNQVDKSIFIRKNVNNQEHLITAYKLQSQTENDFTFFFLPKKRDLLDTFFEQEKEFFFNLFHQFKLMRILSSILYFLIQEINQVVKNYGWSILIITLLLKLIILPLTQKSMKAMKRMQELNPKIQSIKNNFKNNPKKMNLEMMSLYRKEKINPLGGCIPMLIPLPIFIAFYSLFRSMVELQGISFLWIQDLSLPDTFLQFDFSLPLIGSEIHLLPIIMTISSFFQSIMTPQTITAENKQQVMIMKYFLPVFFLFISWNMPSALILFWMTQNLFSIGQMLFIKYLNKKKI